MLLLSIKYNIGECKNTDSRKLGLTKQRSQKNKKKRPYGGK